MTSRSHWPLMSSSDGCSVIYRPSNSSLRATSFSRLKITNGTWVVQSHSLNLLRAAVDTTQQLQFEGHLVETPSGKASSEWTGFLRRSVWVACLSMRWGRRWPPRLNSDQSGHLFVGQSVLLVSPQWVEGNNYEGWKLSEGGPEDILSLFKICRSPIWATAAFSSKSKLLTF